MKIEDLSNINQYDQVDVTYRKKYRYGPGNCKEDSSIIKIEGKYFVSRGYEEGYGDYVELTDRFDKGYKTNSIIIRTEEIEHLKITLRVIKRIAA